MNRRALVAGVAVVALTCGLSACGGSDKKAAPKPATTATTPAVPVQPKGANGVTYDIQNWDDYANDPAVLAWKTTNEAIGASINSGKVVPVMRGGLGQSALREYVASLNQARKLNLHVKDVGKVRVEAADMSKVAANLIVCLWTPTVAYYKKDGAIVGKAKSTWMKQSVAMSTKANAWIIDAVKFTGECTGPAPE